MTTKDNKENKKKLLAIKELPSADKIIRIWDK